MIQKQSRSLNPLKWKEALSTGRWFFLFSLVLLTACATERVRVEEVAQRPADFEGEQIKVRGQVEELYGNRAFLLDNDEGEDLFVIAEHPLRVTQALEGKTVEVTGTAERFDRSDIQRDLDTELDREIVEKIQEGEPVIIARVVTGDEEDFGDMGGGRNLIDEPGLDDDELMGPENELFEPGPGR